MQAVLRNKLLIGTAAALCIKLSGSVLSFGIFALCARQMDPDSFGSLAVLFNTMSFLAVLSLCGQQTMIVRAWDEYIASARPAHARGVLTFSLRIIFAAGALTIVIVGVTWVIWDPGVAPSLLISACAFLFAQALMHFSGQFSRVAANIVVAELPREVIWRLVVISTIGICHLLGVNVTASEFFAASAAALLIALVMQVWYLASAIPESVLRARSLSETPAWISRSSSMWASAILDTSSQFLEVVVIGIVLGPTAAAFCFVATRITAVFPMIAGGITGYATSHISRLFYIGAKKELSEVLHYLAVISALLAGCAFFATLVGGKLLLGMYGPIYTDVFPALVVLAAGTATAALTGPAAYLLLLTGNEGAYPRIMGWSLLLRFLLLAVMGQGFGLFGAVTALSLSSVVTSLALVLACRRLIGLDPSLLGAFGRCVSLIVRAHRST